MEKVVWSPQMLKVAEWNIHMMTNEVEKFPYIIEKTLEIKPNEWDKISNSVLINYNPKLIKAQGLKLFIESPVAINRIVAYISDQGNSTITKGHLMA